MTHDLPFLFLFWKVYRVCSQVSSKYLPFEQTVVGCRTFGREIRDMENQWLSVLKSSVLTEVMESVHN